MNATDIKNDLAEFRGTSTYHKHLFPGKSPLLLTDGCNYVRESCKANWLFDAILSYQGDRRVRNLGFQIWQLKQLKKDLTWVLQCFEDTHKLPVVTQKIEYSDFPIEIIRIWVIDGVAILPTEY